MSKKEKRKKPEPSADHLIPYISWCRKAFGITDFELLHLFDGREAITGVAPINSGEALKAKITVEITLPGGNGSAPMAGQVRFVFVSKHDYVSGGCTLASTGSAEFKRAAKGAWRRVVARLQEKHRWAAQGERDARKQLQRATVEHIRLQTVVDGAKALKLF